VIRRGLLGGTFDPIHVGHLDVAEAARRALGLDRLFVVPARVPPHRQPPQASAAHRFAMVALAVASRQGLLASDLEMGSESPAYTTATLDRLAAAGADMASLFLVTGADAFREIETWMGYPHLLDRCHFVVVSRPGCPASSLRAALPSLADRMIDTPSALTARPAIVLVDAPTAPVSSTDVRRRLAEGAPIDGLVPDAVAAHIRRHRLYMSTSAEGLA
jgi:nicotinate-nucleotide adenylyltransferase